MRVLLAGAGLAAQRCAEALRAAGYDGPITMIGAERHAPYDRPPLSKPGPALVAPLRPERWYADHEVDLRLGVRVTELHAAERRVVLAGGASVRYDRLLIATGADPVVPPLFAGAHNVQALRTVEDAVRLRAALVSGGRLAVVGAGLVGQEVASMAVAAGVEVTLVDAAAAPFDALLGPALGAWLAGLHRAAGVGLRLGVRVTGVAGRGRVEALELDDGGRVACDHVVVGIGVRPATGWAGPGATALPGVFAAGDAAGGRRPPGRRRGAGHARGPAPARATGGPVERPARRAPPAPRRAGRCGPRGDRRRAGRAQLHPRLRTRRTTGRRGGGRAPRRAPCSPAASAGRRPTKRNRRVTLIARIDESACLAHGDCAAVAPQAFAVRDVAEVIGDAPEALLRTAARACPAGAIVLIDSETGREIE